MNVVEKIIMESRTQKEAGEELDKLAGKVGCQLEAGGLDLVKRVKSAVRRHGDLWAALSAGDETGLKVKELVSSVFTWEREQLRESLERERPMDFLAKAIRDRDTKLAEWFDKAKDDPYYQLSWGDKAFRWAAERRAYLVLQHRLRNTPEPSMEEWEEVIDHFRDEALSMASNAYQSTSPCSNLAERFLLAVYSCLSKDNSDWVVGHVRYWIQRKEKYERGEA